MDCIHLWVNLRASLQYLTIWWAARRKARDPYQLELGI